jgi:hypothetical protein
MGGASALYTFIVEILWTKFGLKVLFGIPSTVFENVLLVIFYLHWKFDN